MARRAGDLGHEHHRHRRQDHPRCGRDRRVDRDPRRALPRRVPGRRRGAPDDDAGRAAEGDPPHRRDRRADRDAPRAGPRLPDRRRLDLLPDLVVAGVRAPGAPRSRGPQGGGAGRVRRVRQGRRPRLRAVEGTQARRAVVGDGDRSGPAGLAYRMLGDEHGPSRTVVRHPHRRHRPDLPPPRGRDRPERGRDRPDVRPDLAPLRPPPVGRFQDGQVDRQHRAGRGGAGSRRLAAGAPAGADLGPLPGRPSITPTSRWRPPGPRSNGSMRPLPRWTRTPRRARTTRRSPRRSTPRATGSVRRSTTT